jgi:hypothetical protein
MRVPALIFVLTASWLHADGGRPIGQADADGLRVTLFSSSLPVRAGALDAGVLVQEIPSNRPLADASVTLSARNTGRSQGRPVQIPAWCSSRDPGSEIPATASHSANKLLLGAYLPLPSPGRWEIAVSIRRGETRTRVIFPLDVAPPAPPMSTWWPLIALVPLAIAAYAWRTSFTRPRQGMSRSLGIQLR